MVFPLLLPDLPLLSSVGGGRQRVGGGGREGGRKREGSRIGGGLRRRVGSAVSWIGGDGGLGEAAMRKRLREREERVRELMLWVFMRENGY